MRTRRRTAYDFLRKSEMKIQPDKKGMETSEKKKHQKAKNFRMSYGYAPRSDEQHKRRKVGCAICSMWNLTAHAGYWNLGDIGIRCAWELGCMYLRL